ncbi:MAG: hypothetical protein ACJKSS_00445 [Patescibacteria group bacterium UBA2103]
MKMNPVYSKTNLDKSLPIVPVVPGKFSFLDWVVMGSGAVVTLVLYILIFMFAWKQFLILLAFGTVLVGPQNVVMFFRQMMAPQRNPFAAK